MRQIYDDDDDDYDEDETFGCFKAKLIMILR